MPTKVVKVKEKEIEGGPRRAIEYFASSKRSSPLIHVFDEFWREGELALIFGASGTGKSLLAFQVADALARGTPIHGFVMPTGRQKVLYVDFNLSDVQFRNRYRGFKASKNLYRERFIGEGDHFERIKKSVEANGIRVVIIDDLSAIKRTNDGARESLAFIRQLKQLCEELGISVLAVSDAAEPKNGEVSENDLGRSRILCTVADSVFAIGRTRHSEDGRYIIQRRSRSAKVFWNVRNAPVATIKHLESHMLGFEFDERFSPELDQEKLDLILTVKMMHDEGASFRDIGEMLGISKSYAYVAYRKWTPAMETGLQYVDDEELPVGSEKWIAISQQHAEDPNTPEPRKEGCLIPNPSEIPFAAGLKRRSVYDFEFDFDGYGNQIFVETRREHDRKPIVWYRMDTDVTRRFERGAFGIQVQQFAAGPFL